MSVVDTTRVKLHTLEGDDDLSVTSSPFPPSPPSSQHTSPPRSSTVSKGPTLSKGGGDSETTGDKANTSDIASPIGVRFSQGGPKESLDTTIADLNVRRVTRLEDDQESLRSSEVAEDDSSGLGTSERCGITLIR